MYFIVSYMPWPLNNLFKFWLRKKTATKIKKKINSINQIEQQKSRLRALKLWTNEDYTCAALILIDLNLKNNDSIRKNKINEEAEKS